MSGSRHVKPLTNTTCVTNTQSSPFLRHFINPSKNNKLPHCPTEILQPAPAVQLRTTTPFTDVVAPLRPPSQRQESARQSHGVSSSQAGCLALCGLTASLCPSLTEQRERRLAVSCFPDSVGEEPTTRRSALIVSLHLTREPRACCGHRPALTGRSSSSSSGSYV